MIKIAVLMTCHNRKDKTLACLSALFGQVELNDVELDVVLVDDGSSDGTADAVELEYPRVNILKGNGSLFWNRGMFTAQQFAKSLSPDFYLWLNDDTVLLPNTLSALLQDSFLTNRDAVIVGATFDDETGALTYAGAVASSKFKRFTYKKVWNPERLTECDVMNGNIVLVPSKIADSVGTMDVKYEHAMGDTDYALRAKKLGFRILVSPTIAGYCKANPPSGTHLDKTLNARQRWKLFVSRKGLPPKSWLRFVRLHGGPLWPMYFIYPYANFVRRLIFV